MPDLPCEQSLISDFSRKIEGDSSCLQGTPYQTPVQITAQLTIFKESCCFAYTAEKF